jgi:protein-L-isoaspartate(D-aspartate) O-methyltransferase
MSFEEQRKQIVENLERMGYIKTQAVKKAMLKVRREEFVPSEIREDAYLDMPLPIPGGATISAPHMHAISLEALELKSGDKFLEVGAGSCILLVYAKEIVGENGKVFGIEFDRKTYDFGMENLKKTGYWNKVRLLLGDGSLGLPKEAPFDKILVSAASPDIPKPLIKQLKPDGKIVAVVGGSGEQNLVSLEKKGGKIEKRDLLPVIFVPLKGKYGWK